MSAMSSMVVGLLANKDASTSSSNSPSNQKSNFDFASAYQVMYGNTTPLTSTNVEQTFHRQVDTLTGVVFAEGLTVELSAPRDPRLEKSLTLDEFNKAFRKLRNIICKVYPQRRDELDQYEADIIDIAYNYGPRFFRYHKLFSAKAVNAIMEHNIAINWGKVEDRLLHLVMNANLRLSGKTPSSILKFIKYVILGAKASDDNLMKNGPTSSSPVALGVSSFESNFLVSSSLINGILNLTPAVSGTISIIVPGSFEKKLPPHSSLEALEVLSGTLPIDLRREEMAIRELGKINSYSNNVPIKRKFEIWKEKEHPEKFISPLGNYISDYNFTREDNLQERLPCHHDKD
ncbi:unnamed protein product [Mytilus coruscus]|uniref:Uncharacterized protein n=1 Tax=Mytilus coruscus TaxID=42192 RepID=A0A6J8C0Q1_MYTCO|nr:unnamed protein product [Mytilus coruscus]